MTSIWCAFRAPIQQCACKFQESFVWRYHLIGIWNVMVIFHCTSYFLGTFGRSPQGLWFNVFVKSHPFLNPSNNKKQFLTHGRTHFLGQPKGYGRNPTETCCYRKFSSITVKNTGYHFYMFHSKLPFGDLGINHYGWNCDSHMYHNCNLVDTSCLALTQSQKKEVSCCKHGNLMYVVRVLWACCLSTN